VPFVNVLFNEHMHMLLFSPFFLSFLGLAMSYHLMALLCPTTKQASWILTTISSGVMSLASMPFLWAYLTGGGMKSIRVLPQFAVSVVRFFQAYLTADLILGSVYYRSRISLLGGWIHHSMYIIVIELVVRRSWSHIFCLAGSMEIPTLIFAVATFYPHLRSDIMFAISFFMTRILFHIVLLVSLLLEENRMQATGGSFVPAIVFAIIFPLHGLWFVGCVKGFIRRATQNPSARRLPVTTRSIPDRTSSGFTQPIAVYRLPLRLRSLLKLRSSQRRRLLEGALRTFRPKSRSAAEWMKSSRAIFSLIPPREIVLDCVGLRRRRKQRAIVVEHHKKRPSHK